MAVGLCSRRRRRRRCPRWSEAVMEVWKVEALSLFSLSFSSMAGTTATATTTTTTVAWRMSPSCMYGRLTVGSAKERKKERERRVGFAISSHSFCPSRRVAVAAAMTPRLPPPPPPPPLAARRRRFWAELAFTRLCLRSPVSEYLFPPFFPSMSCNKNVIFLQWR